MNILIILSFIIILTIVAWILFGGTSSSIKTVEKQDEKKPENEPEKIFRRRASDRAIEEEYPERRINDDISHEGIRKNDDTQASFELPYSANNIIPDNSRFKMFKRTLINSEIYARKGDIDTAISLFNGVKSRISDKGIKNKIDANIEYLKHYREMQEKDQKKRFESLYSGQQPGELRLKIEGQVPQTINIGIPEKKSDSDDLIKKVSEQISKDLGHLKNEIEKIKSKPEENFDLDDYAQFASLQKELKILKDRFNDINEERDKSLAELDRIREIKEEELKINRERDRRADDLENNEILKNLKNEIKNLTDLKQSLDSLNSKIEDIANLKIPELTRVPTIIEAKYQSPIPVHFDPKPVLDILDKISKKSESLEEPAHTKIPEKKAEDEIQEPTDDELTDEEIARLEMPETDSEPEQDHEEKTDSDDEEPLFPPEPDDEFIPEITGEEEKLILEDETAETEPEIPEPEEDALQEEIQEEKTEDEIQEPTDDELTDEEIARLEMPETDSEPEQDHEEKTDSEDEEHLFPPEPDDEFIQEITDEEEKLILEDETAETEPEIPEGGEDALQEEIQEPAGDELTDEEIPEQPDDKEELFPEIDDSGITAEEPETEPVTEEIRKEGNEEPSYSHGEPTLPDDAQKETEKEKEIDRYSDIDEDPNEFELMSEYGKQKDDSTLTDEEIFEKIIADDSRKKDDDDFKILGEKQKEEQEYSLDEPFDEKKKAEQDFYKKFIKPDRIKKKELPILRVSYDFKKLPDEFSLSREKNILEYSFYKYKSMLEKADDFIKQRKVRDAINYYKVVADQNIPPEFKLMIKRNIRDLTEYLEKYLASE